MQADRSELEPLLLRCRQGERAAFDELFWSFEGQAFRLAVTILRDKQDAEDVLQDVFLRVFNCLKDYRGEASFRTWLTAIVVNACRDRLRRNRLRRYIPLEWLRGRGTQETMDEVVDQRVRRQGLWAQVERLEDQLRLPVILFYQEGLPAEEVGQALNLPVTTVYARLNRARQRLRGALLEAEPANVQSERVLLAGQKE
jgi:RNA polymerase sigma-70 factor (ECF subfamily)